MFLYGSWVWSISSGSSSSSIYFSRSIAALRVTSDWICLETAALTPWWLWRMTQSVWAAYAFVFRGYASAGEESIERSLGKKLGEERKCNLLVLNAEADPRKISIWLSRIYIWSFSFLLGGLIVSMIKRAKSKTVFWDRIAVRPSFV